MVCHQAVDHSVKTKTTAGSFLMTGHFLRSRVCVKMTETEQTSSKKAGGEKCVFISKLAHIIPRPHIVVARAISLNKQRWIEAQK